MTETAYLLMLMGRDDKGAYKILGYRIASAPPSQITLADVQNTWYEEIVKATGKNLDEAVWNLSELPVVAILRESNEGVRLVFYDKLPIPEPEPENPPETESGKTYYTDLLHLEEYGRWPNDSVPEWAIEWAKEYKVEPDHTLVQQAAMRHEIERLRSLVKLTFQECSRDYEYFHSQDEGDYPPGMLRAMATPTWEQSRAKAELERGELTLTETPETPDTLTEP